MILYYEKLLKYYLIQDGAVYRADNLALFEDNFIDRVSNTYATERIRFEGSQFFYNQNGKKILRHSLRQSYNFDSNEMESLENRVNLYYGNLDFANKIKYSYIDNDLSKIQTGLSYKGRKFSAKVWHTYDKNYYDGNGTVSAFRRLRR